jgi:AcrR family transcriptional regulator
MSGTALQGERPNRRLVQAEQTRQEIITAAARLFAEHGYAGTSVADIARAAGVAVQTIYSSVGSKPQIISSMADQVDRIAGIPELAAQVDDATMADEVLGLIATLTRQLNERCGDILTALQSGAQADTQLAAVYATGQGRHRTGALRAAQRLADIGALRSGAEVETAAATIATIASTSNYRQLHDEYGWSYDRCQEWVTNTLISLLLPSPDEAVAR